MDEDGSSASIGGEGGDLVLDGFAEIAEREVGHECPDTGVGADEGDALDGTVFDHELSEGGGVLSGEAEIGGAGADGFFAGPELAVSVEAEVDELILFEGGEAVPEGEAVEEASSLSGVLDDVLGIVRP